MFYFKSYKEYAHVCRMKRSHFSGDVHIRANKNTRSVQWTPSLNKTIRRAACRKGRGEHVWQDHFFFFLNAGTLQYIIIIRNGLRARDRVIFANRSANRGSFCTRRRGSSGGEAADIFCRNKREEKEVGRKKRTGSGRRERSGERWRAKGRGHTVKWRGKGK